MLSAAVKKREAAAEVSRFGVVGLLAMLCHGVALWFWVELFDLAPVLANALAFLTAFLVSYLGHYHWTFRSDAEHLSSMSKFFAVAAAGFLLNLLIMYTVTVVYGLGYWWGFGLIVLTIPLLTYLVSRAWVFVVRA